MMGKTAEKVEFFLQKLSTGLKKTGFQLGFL